MLLTSSLINKYYITDSTPCFVLSYFLAICCRRKYTQQELGDNYINIYPHSFPLVRQVSFSVVYLFKSLSV